MKTFVAVAETGSLSAAARSLREPLTNVSRQLMQLEHHLGTVLVNRTSRRMVLTAEGEEYLAAVREVIEDVEIIEAQITERVIGYSGNIVITAPITLGRYHCLPVINEFLQTYPKVTARLQFVDRMIDLIDEGVDVAVRVGKLGNTDLMSVKIGDFRPVVCASPDYIEKYGDPKSVTELANHHSIIFDGAFGDSRWTFRSSANGRHTIRLRPRISVNSVEAAIAAAEAGMGITRILSYQGSTSIAEGRLVEILRGFDDSQLPVHMLRLANRQVRSLVHEFVRFTAPRMRGRLYDGARRPTGEQ